MPTTSQRILQGLMYVHTVSAVTQNPPVDVHHEKAFLESIFQQNQHQHMIKNHVPKSQCKQPKPENFHYDFQFKRSHKR